MDIENYRTKYITQFIKAQNKWIKKVQGNLESRNYFDPNGKKSDKGHIQYLLWKDFKSNISSLDRKQADISKDKILIYAIALGIPMKDINNYRENIGSDYYPMHWGYWWWRWRRRILGQLTIEKSEKKKGCFIETSIANQ